MIFWRRSREPDLGQELRAARPEPSEELVTRIVGRIDAERRSRRARLSPRLAVAGALGAAMVAAAASTGGLGYAANAVEHVAGEVKSLLVASGNGAIETNLSAGSDQYQPGYGWGDPNHNHSGPPGLERKGGELAPPLTASCDGDTAKVSFKIVLDEQADLEVTVLDRRGNKLPILLEDGTTGDSVEYRVLVPRTVKVTLEIPCDLLADGKSYRVKIVATDPSGESSKLIVPFKAIVPTT